MSKFIYLCLCVLTCNVVSVFGFDNLNRFLFGNRFTTIHIAFYGLFEFFSILRGFFRQSVYLFLDFLDFFFFFGLPRLLPYDPVPYIFTPNKFWLFL